MVALAFEAAGSVSDRLEIVQEGKSSWYECVSLPVDAEHALVLLRDDTYNLNVRKALFESRQRYRDLVLISERLCLGDRRQWQSCFCLTAHTAIGYSSGRPCGSPPHRVCHRQRSREIFTGLFDRRTPMTNSRNLDPQSGDGEEICLEASAVPVVDDEGTCRGCTRTLPRCHRITTARKSHWRRLEVRELVVAYIVNQIRELARSEAMLKAAVAILKSAESASAASL